jgi:lipopolysaccharide/colanic/teichoic acid biosynthesis glycosyltransferase
VLAVGSHESVISLVDRTRRAPDLGWAVVAACTPTGAGPRGSATLRGVPVVGDLDSVPELARSARFDAVSVAQAPGWSMRRLQDLALHLEGSCTELVVDPGLLDNVGPRKRLVAVDELHLLRLTHPALPPGARRLKGAVDRALAALLLVPAAPALLAVTAAIWRDGGCALVREQRVGAGGRPFTLLAFRCTDADGRITPVGAALRRWRLDRLPQLFNVVTGAMALLGPAPLPTGAAGRGHTPLVEPGLIRLRPVGPLAGVAVEELERRYVERWTLALHARLLVGVITAALTPAAQSARRSIPR